MIKHSQSYLLLQVTVCFVSSRPHSANISTTGLLFSGLLLCFADAFVTPGFLKKFSFLKGTKTDRNTDNEGKLNDAKKAIFDILHLILNV